MQEAANDVRTCTGESCNMYVWKRLALAYGTDIFEPRFVRANIGCPAVTELWSDPPVAAAEIEPLRFGTVPGVKDPPLNGSPLLPNRTGFDIVYVYSDFLNEFGTCFTDTR